MAVGVRKKNPPALPKGRKGRPPERRAQGLQPITDFFGPDNRALNHEFPARSPDSTAGSSQSAPAHVSKKRRKEEEEKEEEEEEEEEDAKGAAQKVGSMTRRNLRRSKKKRAQKGLRIINLTIANKG